MKYPYKILLILFALTLIVGCGQKENKNLINARNLIAKEKYPEAKKEIQLALEAEQNNAEALCTSEILAVMGKKDAGDWRTALGRVLGYIAPLNAEIKDLVSRETELDDDELEHLETLIRQRNNSIGLLVKAVDNADKNGEAWVQNIATNSTQLFVKAMLEAGRSYDTNTRDIASKRILKLGDIAVDVLIDQLQNDSPSIRRQAVLFLGKLKATKAIAPLSILLANKDEDFEVLYSVPIALRLIGSEEIIEPLKLVLETNIAQARMHAAVLLGKLKAEASVPELIKLLADDNAYVKTVTISALTNIGQPVVDDLIQVLEEKAANVIPDEDKRETVQKFDYIVNVYIDEDRLEARRNSIQSSAVTILSNILARGDIGAEKSDQVINRLINLLEDDDLQAGVVTDLTNIGGVVVEPLEKALTDRNKPDDIRIHAASILGDINDLRAVETLILALNSDKNKEVRANAAEALGKMKERRAIKALTRALNADEKTRINAITALGNIAPEPLIEGVPEAVEKLINIASDKNERETARNAAITALGAIKPPEAVDLMMKIMLSEDETDVVRQKATWALGEIKDQRAVPPMLWVLSTLRDDIKGFKRHIKGKYRTIRKLNEEIDGLNVDWHPNYQTWTDVKPIPSLVRSEVAISLGKIKGEEVVKPLIKSLKDDKRATVRKSAAYALGEIKGDEVIGPLIDALKDDDLGIVRNEAAVALGKIKGTKVVGPLLHALKNDKYETTRKNAAIGLREVKFHSAAEGLVDILKSQPHKSDENKETETVINEIVTALIKDGAAVTRKPLISALKSKGEEYIHVRRQAAHAIGTIADASAVDEMIAALQDESVIVRERAAALLGNLKQRKAVEPLIKVLNDEQEWKSVRARAAGSLGVLRDESAAEPLLDALNNENLEIRNSVVVALGKIKDGRAVNPLIRIGENPLEDASIRKSAIAALGKIGDKQAEGTILNVLNSETGTLYYAAITALGQLKSEVAVEKLIKVLADRRAHPTARKNAATALKNIGDVRARDILEKVIVDKTEYKVTVVDAIKRNLAWEVFVNAARVFKLSGQAAPKMIERLDDTRESKTIRAYAALALGRTATDEAIKRLNEALSDAVVDVMYAAARALGEAIALDETKQQSQIKTLVDIMKDTEKVKDMRRAATQGLAAAAAPSTVKDLTEILQDTSVHVEIRRDAAIALGNIGNAEAVSALVSELEKTDKKNLRVDIMTALGTAKSQAAVPVLESQLTDEDADIHFTAADALNKITSDG